MKSPETRVAYSGLIVLLTLTALIGFLGPGKSPAVPVIVFPESYQIPSRIPFFARWIPVGPGWAWLWHLKEAVFGKIKPVNIDTDIIAVSQALTPPFGAPTFDEAGSVDATRLRVWLPNTLELKSFRQKLRSASGVEFVNSPRIVTGDGIGASLFVGETIVLQGATNETGVHVSYYTRVRQDLMDLAATIGVVEPRTNEALAITLRTNLNVKARFQIPKGKGIFMLQSSAGSTNQGAMCVIVSTKF